MQQFRDRGLAVQVAAIESILEHTGRGLRPSDWRMPAWQGAEAALRPAM